MIKDKKSQKILLRGSSSKGLYPISTFYKSAPSAFNPSVLTISESTTNLWHKQLGHPSTAAVPSLRKLIPALQFSSTFQFCTHCNMAKSHNLSFKNSINHSSFPFEILHFDVWGPSPIASHCGFKYSVSFIDYFSRYTWIFSMQSKAKTTSHFINLTRLIETQFHTTFKILCSEGDSEYCNQLLCQFLTKSRITHQTSYP